MRYAALNSRGNALPKFAFFFASSVLKLASSLLLGSNWYAVRRFTELVFCNAKCASDYFTRLAKKLK